MCVQGIFALFVLLRAIFRNKDVDTWSCNQHAQTLFTKTIIFQQLLACNKRTERNTLVCQMRRWLPLCKLLGRLLRMMHPMNLIREMRHAQDNAMRSNYRWMMKRGYVLVHMIRDWVKVSDRLPCYLSM